MHQRIAKIKPKPWLIVPFFCGLLLSTIVTAEKSESAVILVVGDSLSAGYGMPIEQGWVALLQQKLIAQKLDYQVVNASISGDTSQGALSRLPPLLKEYQPAIVIIEIGGNDGLRGQSTKSMYKNIAQMIEQSQRLGSQVLLLGIEIPPNFGPRYSELFYQVYTALNNHYTIAFTPSLLARLTPELISSDGIHPTAKAQPILLDNVWQQLAGMLNTQSSDTSPNSPQPHTGK